MALAYLFPTKKIPHEISNPVLMAFFNAMLHCESCAEFSIVLNEAVQRAERQAGRPLEDIAQSEFPTWAVARERALKTAPTTSDAGPTKDQLISALDRLAGEFVKILNGVPHVRAAVEYMKLDNWIEEPAISAAFIVVSLCATKKYASFLGGNLYLDFRTSAAERMCETAYKTAVAHMGVDAAKRHAFSFADQECTRCHDAVSAVVRNFINETPYPMNPVYSLINERIRLASKRDDDEQFLAEEVEQSFRPVFTRMFEVANSIV